MLDGAVRATDALMLEQGSNYDFGFRGAYVYIVYIYMYIHIIISIHTYIYIYMWYRDRERERARKNYNLRKEITNKACLASQELLTSSESFARPEKMPHLQPGGALHVVNAIELVLELKSTG